MELIFFSTAFVCGFVILQLRLPPMIGFLAAGFILHLVGYQSTDLLQNIADLGVTLLLFTIGLKLRVESLTKAYVWAPASIHIVLSTALFSAFIMLLAQFGLPLFTDLTLQTSLLIGFAFSFSSTVFAVKVLEQRGEMGSLHGKVSIGILIMQDIFAVIFLAVSTGKVPNWYALGLLVLLPLIRPIFYVILSRSKHGELLPLFGFFFALLIGYQAFEFAGLKGDLGALIIGMIFAPHKKAGELAKSLLNFKDLMLVGFFLTIGLNANLTAEALFAALIIVLVLPIKVILYYVLTNQFKLRARTSLLSSFTLANFSEFGLIVCALAASNDWVSGEWLAVVAIAVSITFILASPLNTSSNDIYVKLEEFLSRFESKERLDQERPVELADTKILIFGMGRIGTGAYETIAQHYPDAVAGVDINQDSIVRHQERGRNVILADATDPDFWQRINHSEVEMVMLAMPKHIQNISALEQLKASGFDGQVSAIANYPDQQSELEKMGVHSTYNFYLEAGSGFAEHVTEKLFNKPI
ncbi:cation:proton antiporter family protein [Psychrobium sp. 1_MG-2023]|uniref:cation:proton antiporter family protein n=1 Tax=Psychrobium sp. 1_MG-2023 TaxID=3062624 RepID=UPI000C34C0F0|nr:cation:proton antiporter family protein [Psychrobium sp. 1_MG-2023]MDP2561583.1 cation:proton antiporter [Psychrobium sp. 1_MG-2023]PKF55043.1 potassium transporter Kef [Alteromonadales bacterium alter-6D02]